MRCKAEVALVQFDFRLGPTYHPLMSGRPCCRWCLLHYAAVATLV